MVPSEVHSNDPINRHDEFESYDRAMEIIASLNPKDLDKVCKNAPSFITVAAAVKLLNPDVRVIGSKRFPIFECDIPAEIDLLKLKYKQHRISGGRARFNLAASLNVNMAFDRIRDNDLVCIGMFSKQENFEVARAYMEDEVRIVVKKKTEELYGPMDFETGVSLCSKAIAHIIKFSHNESEYFKTRDLTINEVLCAGGKVRATPRCIVDNLLGRIRPCSLKKANEISVFIKALRFAAEAEDLDFDHQLIDVRYPKKKAHGALGHFLWVHLGRLYKPDTNEGYSAAEKFLNLCLSHIPELRITSYPDIALRALGAKDNSQLWKKKFADLSRASRNTRKFKTRKNLKSINRFENFAFGKMESQLKLGTIQVKQKTPHFRLLNKNDLTLPSDLPHIRLQVCSQNYHRKAPFSVHVGEISVYRFTTSTNSISNDALKFANQVATVKLGQVGKVYKTRKNRNSILGLADKYAAQIFTDREDHNKRIAAICQYIQKGEMFFPYLTREKHSLNSISYWLVDIVRTVKHLQGTGVFLCRYKPEFMFAQNVARRTVVRLYDTQEALLPALAYQQARFQAERTSPKFAFSVLKDRLGENSDFYFTSKGVPNKVNLNNWIEASKSKDMSALYRGLSTIVRLGVSGNTPLAQTWREVSLFFSDISEAIIANDNKSDLDEKQARAFKAQVSIDKLNNFVYDLYLICCTHKALNFDKFLEAFYKFKEDLNS